MDLFLTIINKQRTNLLLLSLVRADMGKKRAHSICRRSCFFEVTGQCHTGALHCHYLFRFPAMRLTVPMPAMSSNTTRPSSSTSFTPNFFCFLCYFFSSPLLANIPLPTSYFFFSTSPSHLILS